MNQAVADDYTVTEHLSLKPRVGLENAYEGVNGSARIVVVLPASPQLYENLAAWIRPTIFAFHLVPGTAHAQATKGFVSQL